MSLVPISPWLCLRCGTSQRYGVEPEPCCDDQFAIRVMIDEPPVEIADDEEFDDELVAVGA